MSVLFFSCLRFRKGVSWRPGWSKRHRDWDRSWCRVAVAVLVKPSKNELTPFLRALLNLCGAADREWTGLVVHLFVEVSWSASL